MASPVAHAQVVAAPVEAANVTRFGYRVVKAYPHDPKAFTEGLFFLDGHLYESTGMEGASVIRRVDLDTGKVQRQFDLAPEYFGEGIAPWKDRIIGLTWKHGKAFVIGKASFALEGHLTYSGEGWGLTHDGQNLIMSDGTDRLRFLDPESFRPVRDVPVTIRGKPLDYLNELEWIDGAVYANIWQTDYIVRIDPRTGTVTGVVDLSGLLDHAPGKAGNVDVLNGIAYDAQTRRLFVTGKYWPALFEIELVEKPAN
ncbi:glutaminyl-peptide cyclotransferase [Asticcacaulis sp. BYS171W]|uniref:Glutaminyl-peptide cyclotransferase n=1 Tax=Asticcacaulis aquaticus TaxID=2984212 RepID=A0ABT5HNY5_9CAUL|nr:glutaminyl-peptide cyclotransferase [Asticcacaulis aquaticus]MDC7681776.1 glutaminyl-peptide cyclotransferase [Asticcacaulis aquaticus]